MRGERPAIAIVGAGAAGTTAAWRLYQLFDGEVDLAVFERGPHAGGRAWDLPFAGTRVEVGGTLLHSTGRYTSAMMEFARAKAGGSGPDVDGEDETYGFWTARGFPVFTHATQASLALGIVKHVGPASAFRVANGARELAERWTRVHTLQAEGAVYDTPDDLLQALDLGEESRVSLHEHLRSHKVSDRMIDDVVEPIVRSRYNQGGEINALAGGIGLVGAGLAGGHLFAIEGGTWTLFDRTLRALGADVRLKTAVTRVEGRTAGGSTSYRLSTTAGEAGEYDAVVIAAPFALSGLRVAMDGITLTYPLHPYQEVHTTLVAGVLSPAYFGLKPGRKLPSTVFVADSARVPFCSIGVTGYSAAHDLRIYKVFSADRPLADDALGSLFSRVDEVYHFVWPGAYPVLTPGIRHLPFVLQPGLFYACALETAAAAIEVEAVGGYNAAMLAARHLGSRRAGSG